MALTRKEQSRSWVLAALASLGGEASRQAVLAKVEEIFGQEMSEEDLEIVSSRPNELKWQNNLSWERAQMVRDGLLAPYESRGDPWRLTEAGEERAAAEAAGTAQPAPKSSKAGGASRPFDESSPPKPPAKGDPLDPELAQVRKEKAVKGHHELLVSLKQFLLERGWEDIEEIPGAIDLWATGPAGIGTVIFEAKTISDSNELSQTRSAIGQLFEYRLEYGDVGDFICLVASKPISRRRADLFEALEIGIIYPQGDGFGDDNDLGELILGAS